MPTPALVKTVRKNSSFHIAHPHPLSRCRTVGSAGVSSIHSSVSITAIGGNLLRAVSSILLRSTLGCGFGQSRRHSVNSEAHAVSCLVPSLAPAVLLHSITPPVSLRGARLSLSIFSIHAVRNSHLHTFVDTRTCHLSIHRDIHETTGYRTLEILGKTGYATLRRRPSENKGIENRGAIGETGLSRERKDVGTQTPTDEQTTANQPPFKFTRAWTPPRQTIGYHHAIVRFFTEIK